MSDITFTSDDRQPWFDRGWVPIMAVEDWPDIPGHAGQTVTWSGWRQAISADGSHWLVKKKGLFRRWHWRPVNGMFVKLKEVI
jgi:hypothetical protein